MITDCRTLIMYLLFSLCLKKKTDHLSVPWSPLWDCVIMYLILVVCLKIKADHLSVPWSPRCCARRDSIYRWSHSCFMWN